MKAFTRAEFEQAEGVCLQRGKWGNADVWRILDGGGWVVKDFRPRAWWFRVGAGRLLAWREYRTIKALAGVVKAAEYLFMLDRYAVVERFFEGIPLSRAVSGQVPVVFFERLEAEVKAMHRRGIVHLDLRNGGNILLDSENEPVLIDFQSALRTGWLPRQWRRCLEWVDLSGVYKHWARLAPETMGEERERILVWQLKNRKWWRIRGYRLSPRQRDLKEYEKELLARYGE